MQPGFKSRIAFSDADYFNLSDKEIAVARARREKPVPTLAQAERALAAMRDQTPLARRDRALFALAMITGARVSALVSLRLKHVNIAEGWIDQDAREVDTKFAKTFRTYFMPVSERAEAIARAWVTELATDPARGPDAPLFPATEMGLDETGGFAPKGLLVKGWADDAPVRRVFKRAFAAAGLPYFSPHRFRDMLVRHAMSLNLPAETLKAWSQNLGHSGMLTTLTSYGAVPTHRQGELVRGVGNECRRQSIGPEGRHRVGGRTTQSHGSRLTPPAWLSLWERGCSCGRGANRRRRLHPRLDHQRRRKS